VSPEYTVFKTKLANLENDRKLKDLKRFIVTETFKSSLKHGSFSLAVLHCYRSMEKVVG